MARERRTSPEPDGARAIYEAGLVVSHLRLDTADAIREAIPLARTAAVAVKTPSTGKMWNVGDFTGMPIGLFQNWLYEQNHNWHFSDGTLATLWKLEFPRAMDFAAGRHHVRWTRREYNAGRHQAPAPRVPSTSYPSNRAEPRHAILKLRWIEGQAKGFVDWIPMARFGPDDNGEIIEHEVRGNGTRMLARCRVTTGHRTIDLDYADPECRTFNSEQDVVPGTMRLHFIDDVRTSLDTRSGLPAVEWKQNSKPFQPASIEVVEVSIEAVSWIKPRVDQPAWRTLRSALARPGQSLFRDNLRIAYGGTCCVSGCGIWPALEGAHIEPYGGPHSDDPSNGLLLRADIHALFDALLVTIEPGSLQIRIATSVRAVRGGATYKRFHNCRLAEPKRGSGHRGPSQVFLRSHWDRAKARHGESSFK